MSPFLLGKYCQEFFSAGIYMSPKLKPIITLYVVTKSAKFFVNEQMSSGRTKQIPPSAV